MADCSVISWDNPGARRLTCRALVFSGEYEPDGEVPELPGCHFFYSMKIGCYSFPGVCHSQAPKSVFQLSTLGPPLLLRRKAVLCRPLQICASSKTRGVSDHLLLRSLCFLSSGCVLIFASRAFPSPFLPLLWISQIFFMSLSICQGFKSGPSPPLPFHK